MDIICKNCIGQNIFDRCGNCNNYSLFEQKDTVKTRSILNEADELIHGERRNQYGDPVEQFRKVAKRWSEILNTEITAYEVVRCMIELKLVREQYKHSRDNLVDIAGYTGILAMLEGE